MWNCDVYNTASEHIWNRVVHGAPRKDARPKKNTRVHWLSGWKPPPPPKEDEDQPQPPPEGTVQARQGEAVDCTVSVQDLYSVCILCTQQ